jgi:chromate transporter
MEKLDSQSKYSELALVFLRLGLIGFGGPQAHIAMIDDEAVARRNWLSPEEFSEGLAICEMLPGPASTQMGIYTGYVRGGQLGAIIAGLCFIAPAFLIVILLTWAYFSWQELPQIKALFLGISPVITAIILGFCWKLGKKTLRTKISIAIAIVVLLVTIFSSLSVLVQFIVAGLVGLVCFRPPNPPKFPQVNSLLLPFFPLYLGNLSPETLTISSFWGRERIPEFFLPLTLFFLKVGSFIFGGGLVIIPLLETEVVEKFHWLTTTEFINGVAIGQISPGPVVLTAAFVGYKVAGFLGALVAAIAIFTPSFAFIMLAAPLLKKIRQNPWVKSFLMGVTPAVLGAIAAAAIPIAQTTLIQTKIVTVQGGNEIW